MAAVSSAWPSPLAPKSRTVKKLPRFFVTRVATGSSALFSSFGAAENIDPAPARAATRATESNRITAGGPFESVEGTIFAKKLGRRLRLPLQSAYITQIATLAILITA